MIITKGDGTEEVSSGDALVCFLFDLLRDHVPLGVVEKILKDMEDSAKRNGGNLPRAVFVDAPNFAKHVFHLADRLHKLTWGEDSK